MRMWASECVNHQQSMPCHKISRDRIQCDVKLTKQKKGDGKKASFYATFALNTLRSIKLKLSATRTTCLNPKSSVTTRVKFTDRNRSGYRGNRSNRSGPVPVWGGYKPVQIQNSNLNLKKMRKFLKILQVATNLMVSNCFKYSFI